MRRRQSRCPAKRARRGIVQRIRDRVLPAAAAAAPIKVTPAQAGAPIAAPVSDPYPRDDD